MKYSLIYYYFNYKTNHTTEKREFNKLKTNFFIWLKLQKSIGLQRDGYIESSACVFIGDNLFGWANREGSKTFGPIIGKIFTLSHH